MYRFFIMISGLLVAMLSLQSVAWAAKELEASSTPSLWQEYNYLILTMICLGFLSMVIREFQLIRRLAKMITLSLILVGILVLGQQTLAYPLSITDLSEWPPGALAKLVTLFAISLFFGLFMLSRFRRFLNSTKPYRFMDPRFPKLVIDLQLHNGSRQVVDPLPRLKKL